MSQQTVPSHTEPWVIVEKYHPSKGFRPVLHRVGCTYVDKAKPETVREVGEHNAFWLWHHLPGWDKACSRCAPDVARGWPLRRRNRLTGVTIFR